MIDREEISSWFKGLQDKICESLESLDGYSKFREDPWQREGGGGGRSRVILNGNIFEKGGVNFSSVYGKLPDQIVKALGLTKPDFFATGVSIVLHPESPLIPIIHMNVRYFEIDSETWWFGGGIDLTPIYINPAQASAFHSLLKQACDKTEKDFYPKFKDWADEYFFIPHRNETRGVGGIFFDRLSGNKEKLFDFVKRVGESFVPAYSAIVNENRMLTYNFLQKKFQFLRRSRYAEFNLVYDKGTKFGLETAGRTESILMSLPPQTGWEYDFQAEPGSAEKETLNLLRKGINWLEA